MPAAGRNDPCPCGSGRRYKHCHGALSVSVAAPVVAELPTPDALVAHALEAHQRGELDAAERGYRAALDAALDHPYALHYLGVVFYQRNRLLEALPLLERAVLRVPHEAEFHNNLGLALAASDRTDEAIASYRRALALNADHAVAWNNLGLALQATNELPAATYAFRRALRLTPDFAQANWNLGLALLARGEFAEGWRAYESRLGIAELGKGGRAYPGPHWEGENPAGKTILLTREQGFGDTLQFARFARMLADRGARVLMESQQPLVRLLGSAPGVAGVYGPDDPLPAYDAHLPLLSVAGTLGITAATIPCEVPYLTPDPEDLAALAPLLEPYRATLKVGLSWAGKRDHANDRRRSCPLALMTPLLEMPGVTWFSLQKHDGEDQIPALPAARRLIQLDARNDFDRKAALLSSLDLVISVDTSNAHLAGALARALWVLLPFAADWRWQLARTDSPWYPTARLFRQPRIGDWNAVIADVQRALVDWHD